jgi:hypothetical protein
MNTQSVPLRRIKVPLTEHQQTQPGDFAWSFDSPILGDRDSATHYIYLHLPGESSWSAIQVQKGGTGGPRVWGWDGNEDQPTLTPSILVHGVWHGYCRAGQLVSC